MEKFIFRDMALGRAYALAPLLLGKPGHQSRPAQSLCGAVIQEDFFYGVRAMVLTACCKVKHSFKRLFH